MTDPMPEWSLRKEIKKRKTQELARQIEAKHGIKRWRPVIHSAIHTSDVPSSLVQPSAKKRRLNRVRRTGADNDPLSRRTSQLLAVVTGEKPERWNRRQRRTAMIAAMLVVSICLFTSALVGQPTAQSAALRPLPTAHTGDVISYLRRAGLPLTGLRTFSVPNSTWNAREVVQFDIVLVGDRGTFLVLSYDSLPQAGVDAFKAAFHPKFKDWTLTQISNILVLAAPGATSRLISRVSNYLSQYLVAPYRSFIPTIPATGKDNYFSAGKQS
jgi:hypothetical protein